MAALGDSITVAYGSCLVPASCTRNSWATGEGTRVSSHYRRILAANPAIRGRAHNYAVSKAQVADLAAQARSAVSAKVDYVVILIGANDLCHGTITQMTSVSDFRTRFDEALRILVSGLPKARILVSSLPNIYQLWSSGRSNRIAVKTWASYGICPALLDKPASTAAADQKRRDTFRERLIAYNTQIAISCGTYRGHCRDDGGKAYRADFSLKMINATDFFHPNSAGQNALAKANYPGGFAW
jgi:lysophospholipase L1-like esterase